MDTTDKITMDVTSKDDVITELNNVVNTYVRDKDLFKGGCCFSAYVLAEILRKLGMKYNVVLFLPFKARKSYDFDDVINISDHVAIEVRRQGRRFIIGDYSALTDWYKRNNMPYTMYRLKGVLPESLREAYRYGCWNDIYDTSNNAPLAKRLNAVLESQLVPAI